MKKHKPFTLEEMQNHIRSYLQTHNSIMLVGEIKRQWESIDQSDSEAVTKIFKQIEFLFV